ncbi:MAG: DUF2909 domain-containing protein [Legionella sp.]
MLTKILIVMVMLVILLALASGLTSLIRNKDNGIKAAIALSWRIGLSLILFIFLFIAFRFGWIIPHQL